MNHTSKDCHPQGYDGIKGDALRMPRPSQMLDSGECSPERHAGKGMVWLEPGEAILTKSILIQVVK